MTQVINPEQIDILKPFFVSRSEWYNQIVSVGGGDITGVTAGAGMTGGGLSGDVTLNVIAAASSGLTINADDMTIDLDTTPGLQLGAGGLSILLNATASGLELTSGLAIADSIAGAGLTMSASKVLSVDSVDHSVLAGDGLGWDAGNSELDVNVGDGLAISADNVVVDLATTSGLNFSGGDLLIGAGDGINVLTNTIEVDVTDIIGDGLVEDTLDIALGTPGTLTVATSNAVTASSHTHAITTSDNPGAAASILASSASGYLELERLGVGVAPAYLLHAQGAGTQLRLSYNGSNHATFATGSGGTLTLSTTAGLTVSPGTVTRFNNDVGINVAPARTLHIFETTANAQLRISYDGSNKADFFVQADGDLNIAPDTDLIFTPGGGEVVVNADVGINVLAPAYALQVRDTATPQIRVEYDATYYGTLATNSTGNMTVGAVGNIGINPAGDVWFDPTGNDVYPLSNYDLNLGLINKKWLTLHAAELWVETLVAQDTIATIGGRILVGPTTMLDTDLAPATTTISVEHNQMAWGDIVYMEADGKVEFFVINSDASGGGPYTYTVIRNLDGTGANQWYAGDAMFNTGTTGDGFIDLFSFSGVTSGTVGPTIVGNVRQTDEGTQYLENPGFEQNWLYWGRSGTTAIETVLVYAGAKAAKLTGTGSQSVVEQNETVAAGEVYLLDYWHRGDGTYAGEVEVFRTDTWGSILPSGRIPTNSSATYVNFRWYFVIPTGISTNTIACSFRSNATSGAISYWDEIKLYKMSHNNWTEHWAIGNLNGVYGYGTDTYGAAFGDFSENYITIDPTDGLRFFDTSDVVIGQLTGTNLTLGGSTPTVGSEELSNIDFETIVSGSELVLNPGFETAGGGDPDFWANWTENAGSGTLQNDTLVKHSGNDAARIISGTTAEELTNGGFETAGGGGADIWGTWTETAGDGTLANETTIVHSGADAAKITAGASSNTEVWQGFTVAAGEEYQLSFWTRGDGTNGGNYRVYDNTGAADIIAKTATGITGTTYTQITVNFYVPTGSTDVRIYLLDPDANGGVAYFDDVSVIEVNDTFVYQDFTVSEGHLYRISFWCWGDSVYDAQYRIYDVSNAADIIPLTATGNILPTWVQVSNDVVAPDGCSSIRIYLVAVSTPTGRFNTFDDVSAKVLTLGTWSVAENSLGAIRPDSTTKNGGTYSALADRISAGAPEVELTQSFTSAAYQHYRLQFWSRGDGTNAGTYRIADGSGDIVAETSTGVTAATWTQVTAYFTARSSSTSITLYLGAPNSVGYANFDDVSIAGYDEASTLEASASNGIRFLNSSDTIVGQWLESHITLGQITREHINIDEYGLEIRDASTVWTTLAAGSLAIGQLAGDHVLIDTTGLSIKDGSTVRGQWQTDGDIFIGSDISLPAETYLSVFSQAQTYNTESMAAGALLIGDNSGATELLTDGGLELWDDAFTLTNWSETGGGNLDREASIKRSGSFSAKISHAAGTNKINQTVSVSGSTRYLLSGYGDPGASDSISESYAVYDITNTSYIATSPATTQIYHNWTRFEETFTTASNTTQVRIELWGDSAADMYWDDISLVEGPYLNFLFDRDAGTIEVRRAQENVFDVDSSGVVVYGKHLLSTGIVTLDSIGVTIDAAYTEGPGPSEERPALTILDTVKAVNFLKIQTDWASNGTTEGSMGIIGPTGAGPAASLFWGYDSTLSRANFMTLNADELNINAVSIPVWGSWTRTAATSAADSATIDVTWTVEVADTDTMWTSGSDIAINTTGVYVLVGQTTWANPSNTAGTLDATNARQLLIRKGSSTELGQTRIVAHNTITTLQQTTAIAYLLDSDTVQLTVRHTEGAALNYSATTFSLTRMI